MLGTGKWKRLDRKRRKLEAQEARREARRIAEEAR
jgi:hypothetical protein